MQTLKMINTLLHKPVMRVVAQLPCAHMACLRTLKPEMTKTDFLEIRFSTTILVSYAETLHTELNCIS